MRFATLTTCLLGAVLHVAAQTPDPSQVAAIIAKQEETPGTAAKFNLFSGREVRFLLFSFLSTDSNPRSSTFLTSMKEWE